MFPAVPVPIDALPPSVLRDLRSEARRRGRRPAPITRAMLEEALAQGLSLRRAAAEMGVSPSAIVRAARREGMAWPSMAEAQRRRFADPAQRRRFADQAQREALAEAQRRRWADPARNPLAALTPEQRADYDLLRRRGGLSRDDALRAIGRADLIRGVE